MFHGRQSPQDLSRLRRNSRYTSPTHFNFFSNFQTSDGNIDIDKIMIVGEKVLELYDQLNPLISKLRRFK